MLGAPTPFAFAVVCLIVAFFAAILALKCWIELQAHKHQMRLEETNGNIEVSKLWNEVDQLRQWRVTMRQDPPIPATVRMMLDSLMSQQRETREQVEKIGMHSSEVGHAGRELADRVNELGHRLGYRWYGEVVHARWEKDDGAKVAGAGYGGYVDGATRQARQHPDVAVGRYGSNQAKHDIGVQMDTDALHRAARPHADNEATGP